MLDNLANDLAILDIAPHLLGERVLNVVLLARDIDIHTAALASEDLGVQTILAQIDSRTIHLVEKYSG